MLLRRTGLLVVYNAGDLDDTSLGLHDSLGDLVLFLLVLEDCSGNLHCGKYYTEKQKDKVNVSKWVDKPVCCELGSQHTGLTLSGLLVHDGLGNHDRSGGGVHNSAGSLESLLDVIVDDAGDRDGHGGRLLGAADIEVTKIARKLIISQ
jgi:hypothetical protein